VLDITLLPRLWMEVHLFLWETKFNQIERKLRKENRRS